MVKQPVHVRPGFNYKSERSGHGGHKNQVNQIMNNGVNLLILEPQKTQIREQNRTQ